jgi:hypothetical protein
MSSLQKFHRRTQVSGGGVFSFNTIGSGDATHGFWLGTTGAGKLIVAPKSTEVKLIWGSSGTTRGTLNTTNGLVNTNTLYSFGSAAHPAAYYAKSLTTGGYNTWYLPALSEAKTIFTNHGATPFSTTDGISVINWTSTERDATNVWFFDMTSGTDGNYVGKTYASSYCRAIRVV